MKEIVFIRKNAEKWRHAEKMVHSLSKCEPDHIANAYEDLSADLAFARTHYPDSDIVNYLNAIVLVLHNCLYGNKQQRWGRLLQFWREDIPTEVYRNRHMMLLALLLFVVSVGIGVLSAVEYPDFVRNVMGDGYVEMTLRNIKEGNPMAVYASETSGTMMIGITFNNIMVSFSTYASGVLTCFATAYMMLVNGVMCGAFMTFCHQNGVLSNCLWAMWMHGVIEISSIIVAGGAGLTLGRGWMFPGSYPRLTSFKTAARSSVKIIIGLVPFFIVAGFIESFITRHTEMHPFFKTLIIGGSLVLVLYYFVYLPYRYGRK